MADREVINLDNLVYNKVHMPRIDGNPLYTRVDGDMEVWDKNKAKTDKWVAKSQICYTSPDNVRRIFITGKSVTIHLYQPIIGYSDKQLQITKSLGVDLEQIIREFGFNYQSKYKIKGSGLASASKPWVCSNIEEFYFDNILFMSEEFTSTSGIDKYGPELAKSIADNRAYNKVMDLFKLFNLANINEIENRFPRLRVVGCVRGLEELYNMAKPDIRPNSIKGIANTWANSAEMVQAIKLGRASLHRIEGVPNLSYKRSIKSNLYLYDKNVLEEYFDKLEKMIIAYAKAQSKEGSGVENNNDTYKNTGVSDNKVVCEEEILLESIYRESGIEAVRRAIQIAYRGDLSAKSKIYDKLTENGKETFGALLK